MYDVLQVTPEGRQVSNTDARNSWTVT